MSARFLARLRFAPILALLLLAAPLAAPAATFGPHVEIAFSPSAHAQPITGRVYFFLTTDGNREPRFQSGGTGQTAPFFGVDVSQLRPGESVRIGSSTLGFPVASLTNLPAGDYYVQALLNVYTEFHRADGHTIWAHMDHWEGQDFSSSPGNLISEVVRVHFDPSSSQVLRLTLTKVLPPVQVPPDTEWVRHIKIQSQILTRFWGHPMYLGAVVLLPKGYALHPDQYYPVDYEQDHFSLAPPYHFRTEPVPPLDQKTADHRATILHMRYQEGYKLYQDWSSDNFPRMLMVTFLHPTPYFDDSYAVNSANDGPYGDAIMTELIPYIETHFRIIRQPWARVLSGGSTGGWESFALQIYHPGFFGGAWIYYPDPVDFHRWQLSDVYSDDNAFTAPGTSWLPMERPYLRSAQGQVLVTVRQQSQLESVLGSHGRSCEQEDGWGAVYGLVGADGYPKPLFDQRIGTIDHSVALSMKENGFDLTAYLAAHWPSIGPSLAGKLHFYVGDMDSYYLNLAVYRLQDTLGSLENPSFDGTFSYGHPMKGHGIRPTTTGDMLRDMAAHILKHAPPGEPQNWYPNQANADSTRLVQASPKGSRECHERVIRVGDTPGWKQGIADSAGPGI